MSIVPQRLQFFTIQSRNLVRARQFYVELLGFPAVDEKPGEFFQISIAGVPVCIDLNRELAFQPNQIGITVADLEETVKILEGKQLAVSRGRNAGETWASIKDPDGHEIIFIAA